MFLSWPNGACMGLARKKDAARGSCRPRAAPRLGSLSACCVVCAHLWQCEALDCWTNGYVPEVCCNESYGTSGNTECWTGEFTFEACCMPGSKVSAGDLAVWLVALEEKYGGYHEMPCASPLGMCSGGDRMAPLPGGNGYARQYGKILRPFMSLRAPDFHLAEIGVLAGVGLAIWSELFPQATLHGFDMSFNTFRSELPSLLEQGAFYYTGFPKLHVFDQLTGTALDVRSALQGAKCAVVIDDGDHSEDAALRTFTAFAPHLSEGGLYVIEDAQASVRHMLQDKFPEFLIHFEPGAKFGKGMMVLTRNASMQRVSW